MDKKDAVIRVLTNHLSKLPDVDIKLPQRNIHLTGKIRITSIDLVKTNSGGIRVIINGKMDFNWWEVRTNSKQIRFIKDRVERYLRSMLVSFTETFLGFSAHSTIDVTR